MVRTLRSRAFASRGIDVTTPSLLLTCLVRNAGWLMSHCAVGRDGLTYHQRLHGRPYKSEMPNFLEMWSYRRGWQEARLRSLTIRGANESVWDSQLRWVNTTLELMV